MKFTVQRIASVFFGTLVGISCLYGQGMDVRGTVVDSSNGERIAYASVVIQGTSKGAATNSGGFFLIPNVEPGKHTFVVTCVGYVKQERTLIVGFAAPLDISFKLVPEPVQVSETVVTGNVSRDISDVQTSVHTLEPKDIRAVPVSAMPDILRAIQILPGIVSTSDVNSHFYVRGGAGDQNLFMLDGMKIYNPFHALGIFSIFDPDIIRTTEVYTGAFPPGYGGRLSSVVSLSTKDGNSNQVSGKANVNFLSSKLQLEGPIGENFTWLADARKSFKSATFNRFFEKDLPVSFYDAFFKLTAKVTEDKQVRYGLQGFSTGDNLLSGSSTEPDYSWRNSSIGFTANGLVLGRVYIDAVAYETYFEAHRDPKLSPVATPASTSIQEAGIRSNATLYMDSKDLFYIGFEMSFPNIRYSLVNTFGVLREDEELIVNGWMWVRYQTSIGPWKFDGGVHMDAITLMIKGGLENLQPRINVSRALIDNWKLKLAFGQFTQNFVTVTNEDDVVSIFDTWIHIPDGMKPEQADHYVVGLEGNILPEFSVNVQSYLKNYHSLVVYNRDKIDALDPDFISAAGKSYGAELLLRYSVPLVDLYGTYTWSKATITSQGLTYPPRYDRQNTINLLGVFHPVKNVEASLRWEYGSGFPYSQSIGYYDRLPLTNFYLDPFVFGAGSPYISLGPKNAARLPAYHRLDLSLSYRFQISSLKARAGVNIINVYDHQNIFYFDRNTGQQVNMLPFFPTATLEIEY
jgi:hypothetical protein